MKFLRTLLVLVFFVSLLISNYNLKAQTFDGEWKCLYRTLDDQPNSTGYNNPSVGVIKENTFVALVTRLSNNTSYLVGYTNADSLLGRMGYYAYGTAGIGGYRQPWTSGFDQVEMQYAEDLEVSKDSLVYVANNDASSNILVFRMSADSVISTDYRMATDQDSIWAIDIDGKGYVYVSSIKDTATTPSQILIYKGIADDPDGWAVNHNTAPISTITMPEPGQVRGVTVNAAGTVVYASLYHKDKVYCFTGNPTIGFTLNNAFNFTLTDEPIPQSGTPLLVGPWGLNFMETKNVLFLACAANFQTGDGYEYSRIYALNPNTGAILDTIDVAEWNYSHTGSYTNYDPGNVPGYASTYNIDFDENFNLYDVSHYAWTINKWQFTGVIPTIPLTITGIVKDENIVPADFTLSQNFPNPFNPSTTIEFSLPQDANLTLSVYSVNGELVTTLINGSPFTKGSYKLTFDASKLASGNYIYVLSNDNLKISRKMTLIK
ncbi:MAG: T9SS type A sorting domain-containing protein [Ignavibacteriaceae bacterium]|nr:T9SS type A sorting domain-containing protein [Ignavibacteriaceae bacterium]